MTKTLEQIVELQIVLTSLQENKDFTVSVLHKIARLQLDVERFTTPFYKARQKAYKAVKIEVEGEPDRNKVTIVGLDDGIRIAVPNAKYHEITEELNIELEKEVDLKTEVTFKISDFEKEVYEEVEKGKKEKVKKSLVSSIHLKVLNEFID